MDDTDNPLTFDHYHKHRAYRGDGSARDWSYGSASNRGVGVGFRPAVEGLDPGALAPDKNGVTVIGTLYMDGQPVRVPRNPVWDGDVTDYIPGASLEIREPLADPAYQVKGFVVGHGVAVADRTMLREISYQDIEDSVGRGLKANTPGPSRLTEPRESSLLQEMACPQILYRAEKEYQVRVPTKKEFDRLVTLLTLPYGQAKSIDRQAVRALENHKEDILPRGAFVQGKSKDGVPVCMVAAARSDATNKNISAIIPFTKVVYYERKANIPTSRIYGFSPVLKLLTPRTPDDGPLPDVLDDVGMFFDNAPQKGKTAINGNKIWNNRMKVSFAVTDIKSAKNAFILIDSESGLYLSGEYSLL